MKDIIPGLDAVTSTSGAFVSSGAGRPRVVRKPAALRHRSTARGDIASSTASGSIDLARGSADSRWPPHPFIKATSIVVVHSRLRSNARQARALAEQLRRLAERVSPTATEELRVAADEARLAGGAADIAAQEFAQMGIPGIGGGAWQRMWQAAREFVESEGQGFPSGGEEPCPLCLQPLDSEAAGRLEHFERHVRSSLQHHARATQVRLREALTSVDERQIAELDSPFVAGLAEREPELHQSIEQSAEGISVQMSQLRADPSAQPGPLPMDNAAPTLDAFALGKEQHADTLLAAADPEQEASVRQELVELEDREKLAARLDDAAQWLVMLARVRALREARTGLDRVAQWDSQPPPSNADEAWRRVCDLYADTRNTWERAVEERLFRGVVQRFQREVKTLRLRQVVVSEDLVSAIDRGMTRCSHFGA